MTYLSDLERQRTEAIRVIVREEITRTLNALSKAADELNTPYDTPELDSRAYQAGLRIFQCAVANLNVCWTDSHTFRDGWGQPSVQCTRCGEPEPAAVNPFEEKTHD